MKEKIFKNWGLKLLAVLLAFVVWFLVANLEDYTITKTITGIPVSLLNEEAITSQDLVYEVTEGNTVSVEVKGRRSIVEQLTADDFSATADLSDLSITNSVGVTVEAVSSSVRREVDIRVEDNTLKVAVEERQDKKIPIEVQASGDVQEGYAVIASTASPNMVTVSGSASRVDEVESAIVVVDVDARNDDVNTSGSVILLNKDGEEVDTGHLKLSANRVRVTVTIQKTKEVPIEVKTANAPADGYAVAGELEYEPTVVLIAGELEDLRSVDSIVIDDIDLTGVNKDLEVTKDLSEYLPEDITIADVNKKLAIVIHIEPITERELEIKPSAVSFAGAEDGFAYELDVKDNETFTVKIKGLEDVLDGISVKDLEPAVDVSDLSVEGKHTVLLTCKAIDGVEYTTEVYVTVSVERKKTGATTTEAQTSASSLEENITEDGDTTTEE